MENLRHLTEEELLKIMNSTPTKAQHYANRLTKRASIVCDTHLVDEVIKEYHGYMGGTGVSYEVKLEEVEEREGTPQTKITIVY